MSPTTLYSRARTRSSIVLVTLLLVVAAAWITRPDRAESVVPTMQRIGTLTFSEISTSTVPLRSFSFEVTAAVAPLGTGGGAGKAELGQPVVTLDTSTLSPAELATIVTGIHLPSLTVALYRPNSTAKFQEFVFEEDTFTQLKTETSGPNSAEPRETLGWTFAKVTERIYNTSTGAVVSETCYDAASGATC